MNLKKYLLTAGLAMTIGLADGLSQDQNRIKIEMGSGTRYFVSQRQAEKALVRLSKKSEKEDSWIYYKDSLIDDGINETSETVMTQIPLIIKTYNGDTIKVKINDGDTITSYHNHTRPAPPSIFDMINHSMLIDSIYTNNHFISKVVDNGKMWEFSLEDELMSELRGKNFQERFGILESRINKAYNKVNSYYFTGPYLVPYQPDPKDKKYKEYISIMKKAGIKARFYMPR